MYALFKKEIRYFFTSPIGFTVIGLFVILNGLFLWILKTEYNIFNSNFADLLPFFKISSWIFVFLVPALTMRSISEEKRSGMLTLLFTKPVSTLQIVLGKYFGILFLLLIILIPSVIYIYMVWILGNPVGNLDIAGTIGSYIALFLLIASFAAVGLWASSVSNNQIISFVLAAFLCFFFFFGLDQIVELIFPENLSKIGFQSHFDAISRGVIDSRNIIYFLSVIAFFLYITTLSLKSYKL
ncbi:gliding motility-associated ABC transporter permease subunit GldF [Capnocytophaga stomatis]|uniref:Gliding motility-associated ABC transporter permease subunit GldF n=1 Tax=Capnocytophaga stomatis TaxID=1848904 RepID=A0A250G1Z6_9FLAO|nr:gliding motility-associated ABC transporter permease subunit GldF [Capnocytophaga stomatis]ATA90266.1 gliding motility-associated ABC transporter permease subunit GldF [Capnocytophaga stomatis]